MKNTDDRYVLAAPLAAPLRAYRERLHLNKTEAARQAGVTEKVVRKIERQTSVYVTFGVAEAIARLVGDISLADDTISSEEFFRWCQRQQLDRREKLGMLTLDGPNGEIIYQTLITTSRNFGHDVHLDTGTLEVSSIRFDWQD